MDNDVHKDLRIGMPDDSDRLPSPPDAAGVTKARAADQEPSGTKSLPGHCGCLICTTDKKMQRRATGHCECHQCTKGIDKPNMDWLPPGGRGSTKFITPGIQTSIRSHRPRVEDESLVAQR
ncbi:hypothetical protein HMN09_01004600 [Mycena chlorophos]|uniref:Uncharacterized protein n=1 Tax=Mycena chlorophos TaxID=658473 RepID=A0A8H6SJT7_MYCCL|nr:hypothetical protein HMN09_01004600 [Mycena chlorophos]